MQNFISSVDKYRQKLKEHVDSIHEWLIHAHEVINMVNSL